MNSIKLDNYKKFMNKCEWIVRGNNLTNIDYRYLSDIWLYFYDQYMITKLGNDYNPNDNIENKPDWLI